MECCQVPSLSKSGTSYQPMVVKTKASVYGRTNSVRDRLRTIYTLLHYLYYLHYLGAGQTPRQPQTEDLRQEAADQHPGDSGGGGRLVAADQH